jgi:hypothetical protein
MTGSARVGQIARGLPARIRLRDQVHFPHTRPTLEAGLALDCELDFFMMLCPDQDLQAGPGGEDAVHALFVLCHPSRQVTGHADVDRAVRPVRHDVDPSTTHVPLASDGRVKPGHDGGRVRCGRDDGRRVGPARDGSGRDMPGHHAGSDRIAPARDGDARIKSGPDGGRRVGVGNDDGRIRLGPDGIAGRG